MTWMKNSLNEKLMEFFNHEEDNGTLLLEIDTCG